MKRLLAAAAGAALLAGCAVTTRQEVQMGANYSTQLNAKLPIIQDPAANRYVTMLGDSIAKLADQRQLTWHFYLVDDSTVNAFALPGGYIYVNRGLVERATQMDELAGALGHEIGHVTRRHTAKTIEKQRGATAGIVGLCVVLNTCNDGLASDAINVGTSAVFARFSREDEAEADAEGVKNVVRAGIDPRGMRDLFQVLLSERSTKPAGVSAWFASHPMEEDRIAHVDALIAQVDPAILATLTRDTPRYDDFRRHLLTLPHVPKRAADTTTNR
jgi:predicted Zn-dependent protease